MSLRTCAECSTQYAPEFSMCPHCGNSTYLSPEGVVIKRLPLFVRISCGACGRGPWQFRLPVPQPGLVQLPVLHCASCGSQVQVPWPPVEEDMPKITVHGGPTNARETDLSPAVDASEPLAGAEAGQGHPLEETVPEPVEETEPVVEPSDEDPYEDPYEGKTLAELRELATARELPSYGTKAQIIERLREDDAPTE